MELETCQEEGEILDFEEEIECKQVEPETEQEYELVGRPEVSQSIANFQQLQHSDSNSDESDEEKISRIKQPSTRKSKYNSKSGNLWTEMLHEEDLTNNLKSCEVNRKRKFEVDRGVETYDLDSAVDLKKPRTEDKSDEPRLVRKFAKGGKVKSLHKPKILPDLSHESSDITDEVFGKELCTNLDETNEEIIQKVISVAGREQARKLYEKTQNLERNGGMLIMNKTRRRTSGGIFLFLVKSSNDLSDEQKKQIFDNGKQEEVKT